LTEARLTRRMIGALLIYAFVTVVAGVTAGVQAAERFITLGSTTSTQNSGLFDALLPSFGAKIGIEVRVVAVGTGQALKLGERGDVDLILVHDRKGEDEFVAAGYGIERRDVMYNDFVIVGPAVDPAGIKGKTDAAIALQAIAAAKAPFVSRGDDSGTHRLEQRLWKETGVDVSAASGTWYRESGSGMGATLNTAAGLDAYVLTDRATWLAFKNKAALTVLVEGDDRLFNQYGVILVNPARHAHIRIDDARAFRDWLVSPEGQSAISMFAVEGQQVFFPNAK